MFIPRAIIKKRLQKQDDELSPPWWINPFYYCLFFLLPSFLVTVAMAAPYMGSLGQSVNNLTLDNVMLGVLSINMFMLGCLPCIFKRAPRDDTCELDPTIVNRALLLMGSLSLVCNLIFFGPIAMSPEIVLNFLRGGSEASYQLRHTFDQIPGITSFISASLPFFALYSAMTIGDKARGISRANRFLFKILFVFVAARAILGSERLALVEACVAYGVPRAAFLWRPGRLRTFMPFLAVGGVFALFCVGEYFRSWQYYKDYYYSFYDFITVRFFGYFATSINNGAGVVTSFPSLGMPGETVDGFYALLRIFGIDYNPGWDVLNTYLNRYATPEFNNPGGLYMPYMDYGIPIGLVVFIVMGIITGLLYRQFLSRKPIGLLLYPSWFLALLDIIRTWTWGGSRFVPVIIVASLAAMILRVKKSPKRRRQPLKTQKITH